MEPVQINQSKGESISLPNHVVFANLAVMRVTPPNLPGDLQNGLHTVLYENLYSAVEMELAELLLRLQNPTKHFEFQIDTNYMPESSSSFADSSVQSIDMFTIKFKLNLYFINIQI